MYLQTHSSLTLSIAPPITHLHQSCCVWCIMPLCSATSAHFAPNKPTSLHRSLHSASQPSAPHCTANRFPAPPIILLYHSYLVFRTVGDAIGRMPSADRLSVMNAGADVQAGDVILLLSGNHGSISVCPVVAVSASCLLGVRAPCVFVCFCVCVFLPFLHCATGVHAGDVILLLSGNHGSILRCARLLRLVLLVFFLSA